ncbi:MAG TPA: hypothetical protein VHA77_06750 [Xanthobacteraceae bacterium]|jgi:hypothetical protein|nr:hypothetical protein [Xanthobacteraceae bacterium]
MKKPRTSRLRMLEIARHQAPPNASASLAPGFASPDALARSKQASAYGGRMSAATQAAE